jgi:transcriptional regulator NrdR family protein
MTCSHNRTGVTDSRKPDYHHRGGRAFKPLPFECVFIRRRKCLDCGERFSTYEIPQSVADMLIDNLPSRGDVEKEILARIGQYLAQTREDAADA